MGAKAVDWFTEQLKSNVNPDGTVIDSSNSCVMLGIVRRQYRYTPFEKLMDSTDFE